MLNINLSKFIHPNFKNSPLVGGDWKIYPPEPISTGIILETLRLPTEIIEQCKIFQTFIDNIEKTPFIEEERESLLRLKLPLMILLLVSPDAPREAREFFRNIPTYFKIEKFMEFYQQDLIECLEDQKARPGILKDIQIFWARFHHVVRECSLIGVGRYVELLGDIPPHLPTHYVQKLALLSLYPDYSVLMDGLKRFFPKLRVLNDNFQHRPISPMVFWELLQFIGGNPKGGFISTFNEQLWELHLYKDGVFPIRASLTDKELLGQILCYMLPNWAQVWCEIGYPFTSQIKQRLKEMKQQRWLPPIDQFIKTIIL